MHPLLTKAHFGTLLLKYSRKIPVPRLLSLQELQESRLAILYESPKHTLLVTRKIKSLGQAGQNPCPLPSAASRTHMPNTMRHELACSIWQVCNDFPFSRSKTARGVCVRRSNCRGASYSWRDAVDRCPLPQLCLGNIPYDEMACIVDEDGRRRRVNSGQDDMAFGRTKVWMTFYRAQK